ncbi:MAG: hypothetical protein ACYTHJ_13905 [Planctomycetota bacterium]|jgi:hypothetical protein
MTRLAAIWDRAKAALTFTRDDGRQDLFLWEQSARVASTAREIAKLDEVDALRPDEMAVTAAALFQNAAWVAYVQDEVVDVSEVLIMPPGDDHFVLSAKCLEKQLTGVLADDSLQRAMEAVVALNSRSGDSTESLVLSDAVQLEEFGMSSLWPTIRRGLFEGHTIQSVIERWRRRSEYHFWTARLEESFNFEAVRILARHRLERLGRVMTELEWEQNCKDLWSER